MHPTHTQPYRTEAASGRIIPAAHDAPTPDLTPATHWPSFAAGSVFTLVVFVIAQLAVRA